ncbi:mucoidy inhibitor MuiA family protein, partial [bacterium]|nr:mucoidy inhibitor MuiA family protein [bacterium]
MSARFLLPLLAALCCLSFSARADDTPVPIATRITDVTVYRDRADVRRVAEGLALHAGRNVLRIAGLPPRIDAGSVRASGSSATDIHIVNIDVSRADARTDPTPEALRELEEIVVRSHELHARKEALQAGRDFLDTLMRAQAEGETSLVTLTTTPRNVLSNALSFLTDEIVANRLESSRVADALRSLDDRAAELRGDRDEGDTDEEEPWNVDVELDASAAGHCDLAIEYTAFGASWRPEYDIEVSEDLAGIRITYEANVSQSTGENWDGVRVKLSST